MLNRQQKESVTHFPYSFLLFTYHLWISVYFAFTCWSLSLTQDWSC